MTSPISNGANALKLENEIVEETSTNSSSSEMTTEQIVTNHEVKSIVEDNRSDEYETIFFLRKLLVLLTKMKKNNSAETEHVSNGLENFGVEGESAPDLFSSDEETTESEGLLSSETLENVSEDDDLEIPAFFKKTKKINGL